MVCDAMAVHAAAIRFLLVLRAWLPSRPLHTKFNIISHCCAMLQQAADSRSRRRSIRAMMMLMCVSVR